MADDFWGTYEWQNFEEQMSRVFPEYPIVDIPEDHAVEHASTTQPSADGCGWGRLFSSWPGAPDARRMAMDLR